MDNQKVRTLFNYIGGKTWLRQELREHVYQSLSKNPQIKSYAEPFAGGLGAFLNIYDILIEYNIVNITLSDINEKLINFYNVVKNNPTQLIDEYMKLESRYAQCIPAEANLLKKTKDKEKIKALLEGAENYYKCVRNSFNTPQNSIISAAHLLFVQNHCFNGVYRENAKGGYNTPFNWEAKIFTLDKIKEKILNVHKVFSLFNISFINQPFTAIEYCDNTLYYLDPPYINENIVENKYNKASFGIEQQKLLINCISKLIFIYSNHYSEQLLKEFNQLNRNFVIKSIARKNIISASVESRKTDKLEMLVLSY